MFGEKFSAGIEKLFHRYQPLVGVALEAFAQR
jgi:hypothetical protein